MKKVRVLSLDGGGIRGVIPATVMEYVEEKLKEFTNDSNARVADYFDIIVGTSTGGILGCLYLTPYVNEDEDQTPNPNGDEDPNPNEDEDPNPNEDEDKPTSKYTAAEAVEFYSEKGFDIFNESKRHGWFGLRQLFNATAHDPKNLEVIFQKEFENLKMSELLKPCVITTYNLIDKSSFFFNSREKKEKNRDFYVRDVVRSTAAAPTYFPPAVITNKSNEEEMVNIDGGVFANNPTMCAYAECRNSTFPQVTNPSAKDMLILSIGTGGGQFTLPKVGKGINWGVIDWAKSIPEIMMDGSIDTVHYQMKNIFDTLDATLQANYKRVDVPDEFKTIYKPDMADASKKNIDALKTAGQEAINDAQKVEDNQYTRD